MGPSYLLCRLRVVFVFLGALVLYLPSTRDVDSHMKHDYTSVVRVSSMGPLSEDVFGCSTRRCILGSLHRQLQVLLFRRQRVSLEIFIERCVIHSRFEDQIHLNAYPICVCVGGDTESNLVDRASVDGTTQLSPDWTVTRHASCETSVIHRLCSLRVCLVRRNLNNVH